MKSFCRKDGRDEPPSAGRNGERDFHGEKPSNETHASTTDPDARLARKAAGREAKLAYTGNLLMENRHGLLVDARLVRASGTAECEAAEAMIENVPELIRSRSARTRRMTRRAMLPPCALWVPPRMWRGTSTRIAAPTSMAAPRATRATRSAR